MHDERIYQVGDPVPDPRYTVLTLTYKRPRMLYEALRSLQCQTDRRWECVIYNDGGENVWPMIERLGDPRFVYVHSPENHGFPYGYEWCRENSTMIRGRYVAYLDDDDIYYPRSLAIRGRVLDNNHSIGLVYCDVVQIRHGRQVNYWGIKGQPGNGSMDERLFQVANWIQPLRVMHRRYDHISWGKTKAAHADWLFLKQLMKHGVKFYYHPVIIAQYNWHNLPNVPSNNTGIDGVTR